MNALEKVVDFLAAIILMFLIPLLFYGSGRHSSQAVLAGQTGENFLKRISTAGEITLPVWKEMEDALIRYGCDRYEIQRERGLYEPTSESGTVTEQVCIKTKEELLKEIVCNGKSRLQKGDRIKLILYINEISVIYYTCVRTGGTDS